MDCEIRVKSRLEVEEMHILYSYKHLRKGFLIHPINYSFQIHRNKFFKLNLKISMSIIKSKSKLFSLNKYVKFLDLKFTYPNGA